MAYSQEQISASIALAEEIADAEMKLDIGRDFDLPIMQEITENILIFAGGLYAKMVDDPLARELLPQARLILRQRESRSDAIEETAFGELTLAITGEQSSEDNELEVDETPFSDEQNNLGWHEFLGAFNSGNKAAALLNLNLLLAGILDELVRTDLPAIAPQYEIPT